MEDIFNMIYSEDLNNMACNMFVFTFIIEFVFGIANLIKSGYRTVSRG